MTADIVRQIKWEFDFNSGEISNLVSKLKQVETEQENLADILTLQDKLLKGEIKSVAQLQQAFSAMGTDAQHELAKVVSELEKIDAKAKEVSALDLADQANSDIRNKAGIVGDASGSLSALGSATGIGALGSAGDLLGSVESLAQLKGALAGLPASIGAVATALGPVGIGLIAVLGGLAIAVKAVTNDIAERNKELLGLVTARTDLTSDIAGGLTTDDAEGRIKSLNRTVEEYNKTLEQNQKDYDRFIQEDTGIFAPFFKAFDDTEEKYFQEIERAKKASEDAKNQISALNEAIETGRLTANDRAKAEAKQVELQKEIISQTEKRTEAEVKLAETTSKTTQALVESTKRIYSSEPTIQRTFLGLPTKPKGTAGTSGSSTREVSTLIADLAKIRAGIAEDLFQIRERLFNEERESLIQHEQEKASILDNFAFENEDALYERDARASRQLQNQRNRSLTELSQELGNTLRVLNTNLAQETAQLQRQLNTQIQERYASEAKALNTVTQAVNNLTTASNQFFNRTQALVSWNVDAMVMNSVAKVFK